MALKLGVAAIVKDELEGLREWIAFHRVVGASHFLIADNGSTDGTREFLARLADLGLVTPIDIATPPGTKPQLPAYQRLLAACPAGLDVLAFIDADEFLLPEDPDAESPSLLPYLEAIFADERVGALALNWACFGSAGQRFKEDGLVIERFTRRAKRTFRSNRHYKSLVRPERVQEFLNPHHARLSRGHYVNGLGEPLEAQEQRPGLSRRVVWRGARVNHYITKSVEEFLLGKSPRGSAATPGWHKGRDYFGRYDRNEVVCRQARRLASRVHHELLELPSAAPARALRCTRSRRGPLARGLGDAWRRWMARLACGGREASADRRDLLRRWSLDTPSERGVMPGTHGVLFQGWLALRRPATEAADPPRIRVAYSDQADFVFPLAWDAPDGAATGETIARFRFQVPRWEGRFALCLEVGETSYPLDEVVIGASAPPQDPPLNVLRGRRGWLFLDNDTNVSVDQHRGVLRLNRTGLAAWEAYARALETVAGHHRARVALWVAPSKETVMHRYHPLGRHRGGAVDQVAARLPERLLVYPADELRELGDEAYLVKDTHWSQRGAMRAAVALAESLGLCPDAVRAVFADDAYAPFSIKGDLGGKLTPAESAREQRLTTFQHREHKAYDNGLLNKGRLMVIEYRDALHEGTLLLFGSSSSYSAFDYLGRLFRRVVFVHSAGGLDPEVVEAVAPDFLVAQTNARFMIRAPGSDFSLQRAIRDKSTAPSEEDRERIRRQRIVPPREELERLNLATLHETGLPARECHESA